MGAGTARGVGFGFAIAGWLAAGAGLSGCGDLGDGVGTEPTETQQSEITNGGSVTDNSMHLGALYSQWKNPRNGNIEWFPRPCSSTRLTVDGWYLTARHCITLDGSAGGQLVSASQIKVSERIGPGLSAPSDAKVATRVVDSPEVPRLDVALVYVPGTGYQGTVQTGQLTSFSLGSPSLLVNTSVMAYGYGRSLNNQPNTNAETTPASGAGTLRAGLLPVDSWYEAGSANYRGYHVTNNSYSQVTNHGDSGGPDFLSATAGTTLLGRLLTGVHIQSNAVSSADSLATSEPTTFRWIAQTLGKLYIKPAINATGNATYLDVQWGNSAAKTPVWTYPFVDSSAQHWTYDPFTKAIRNENGKCLDVQWNASANGTPVWMWDCTGGAAQQWDIVNYLTLRNANGKCLDVPGGQQQKQLQIWDCLNNTNQQFFITGAP